MTTGLNHDQVSEPGDYNGVGHDQGPPSRVTTMVALTTDPNQEPADDNGGRGGAG